MEIKEKKSETDTLRGELDKVLKDFEQMRILYSELESTNNHLVSATWRERDMKKKLAETILELNNTKAIVEAQNNRIAESINYSKKIQSAINPEEEDLKKYIKNSFIFYKPKDVISGDFPWLFHNENYLYLAAVDCTGHGVPGAMMSMIGNLLLNKIVNGSQNFTPAEILYQLHLSVVETLKQDMPGSNCNDGMDIGLLRIDLKTKKMLFSGAHRPLLYCSKGEIIQIKGDKFAIGGVQYKGRNNYHDYAIDIKKGDTFFLFSDGITDQMGGPNDKKLMIRALRELLLENAYMKCADLKEIVREKFEEWKGANSQVDDVLFIGLKF